MCCTVFEKNNIYKQENILLSQLTYLLPSIIERHF